MWVIASCVYVPVVDEHDSKNSSCDTYTKSLTLNPIEMNENITVGCNSGDCAAVALGSVIVVTAGSAIISSSIVLTGNTLHWLEYHGTCSEGYLNKAKQLFLDSIHKLQPKSAENEKGKAN